ncbi:oxygenase MpaB family protein [Nocardioides aurantiacus]|uniref:oxygenase MpaB family protein n=1 Tax=Nocardioides aurantiacus TaxID=86796 RepID=UPI00403FB8FD
MLTPSSLTRAAQRRLGLALRSRVAGDDAPERAARIWGAEGERWFTPEDPVWRVNADAAMFPGGIAALLLQSLHPLAMAGVAGHSGYKGDPWGRLQRTSHYLAVTTFGTVADAEQSIAVVRSVHRRVRGEFEGVPYAADDPHLLRWVHVAEVWSFLRAFQTYAAQPLTDEEADLYVRQSNTAASRLGARDLPESVAELEAALAGYRPELRITSAAREATRFMLLNPPVPVLVRPGYALIAAGGVALLPRWARVQLALPVFGPGVTVAAGAGSLSTALVRWGMAGLADRAPGAGPLDDDRTEESA